MTGVPVASTTSTKQQRGSKPRGSSNGAAGRKKTAGNGAKKSSAKSKKPSSSKSATSKNQDKGKGSGSGDGDGRRGIFGAFREHLGAQRRDVGGLLLLLIGILTGLGTYANAAGPVGEFLQAIALGVLGLAGYMLPVIFAWFGLLVMIGRPSPEVGRIAVGCVVLAFGLLGVLHMFASSPDPADGMRGLWHAGGLAGWAVAAPLTWALSIWGASAVLIVVIILGLLVITKTPISSVVATVGSFFSGPGDGPTDDDAEVASKRSADDSDKATKKLGAKEAKTRATLAATDVIEPSFEDQLDDTATTDASTERADESAKVAQPPVARAKMPPEAVKKKAAKVAPVTDWDDYQLPPLDLLAAGRVAGNESRRTIEAQTAALQETFNQFGIDATVARHSRGPTVTRFEIELGPGVQVKKVANMGDDIAYALAAPDVRIVAPIPGKSAVGVEVPNRERDLITLGDILRSDVARSEHHPLSVAMGVDIAGNPEVVNLASMPHLLVSGATGSGKSVTLNGMIHSIIMRTRPDQVRMILIDPKRVELNAYQGAPHLLSPVVTDPRRAADAVQWCVKEMEQRYELLAQLGYRNIDSYNEAVEAGEVEPREGPIGDDGMPTQIESKPLPYILLVIDELADLMLVAPRDVEDAICRIAQMARAVGIHMIIATQRPSVDVITGLIKANIPSRLALQVASQTDSRTIIDMNGAEKLVGKGDMLFLPASQGKPSRLQGCWVTEQEITSAVAYCKAQREAEFQDEVVKTGDAAQKADAVRSGDDSSDEALLRRAAEQVVVSGLGSTSMLQRKLRIGFARAGRIMDELEELGVVGPSEGSKARDVLWSPEELDTALNEGRF